jgi:hypothetical protein
MLINSYISMDPDSVSFLNAAGIGNAQQKYALNRLVLDLKQFGIWTKLQAIYPFLGGTATTHKWNLKDPQNINSAFRLVFVGGWTHSNNGALPNGINTYALTYWSPSINASTNSTHISYYSRTNNNIGTEMGSEDNSTFSYCLMNIRVSASNLYYTAINDFTGFSTVNTDSRGFFVANRTNANNINQWKNNLKTATASISSKANNTAIVLGTWIRSGGSFGSFTTKECAFATMGSGLTDTDVNNLYTAVQRYQTTLGRQV